MTTRLVLCSIPFGDVNCVCFEPSILSLALVAVVTLSDFPDFPSSLWLTFVDKLICLVSHP